MDVAKLYGMLQPGASNTQAVRAVFIVDPKGVVRALLYYPLSNGRNMEEIKRLLVDRTSLFCGPSGAGKSSLLNAVYPGFRLKVGELSESTGKRYHLPSEAQFEYAARAGTTTPWFWGAEEDSYGSKKACEYANTHDEAGKNAHPMYVWSHHQCNDGFPENAPTGKYKPNPWGL